MPEKLEKPTKPAPNECCGGGSCCPCVWDAYFEELRRWKAQEGIKSQTRKQSKPQPIDPDCFYR